MAFLFTTKESIENKSIDSLKLLMPSDSFVVKDKPRLCTFDYLLSKPCGFLIKKGQHCLKQYHPLKLMTYDL
jgi:hypothetical protein